MGSAYSVENNHVNQLLSYLGCSACRPQQRENLDASQRPGPENAPQHDIEVAQPVHRLQMTRWNGRSVARRSMTPPPPRRVSSSDLPDSRPRSRAGFKRPAKSSSRRTIPDAPIKSQTGQKESPSPVLRSRLEPLDLRPSLPPSGTVSPMPDFASLPRDEFNGTTASPWLIVRSIAETMSPQRSSGFATAAREPQEKEVRKALAHAPYLSREYSMGHSLAPEPRVEPSMSDSEISLPGPTFDVHDLLVPESWLSTITTLQLRGRANTDPGQAVRRKRSMTPKREKPGIEDAVRELQIVVGRKRATMSKKPSRERSTRLARTASPTRHVPAIAPSMVLHARTQLLSEIGSALSRPLSDELSGPHFRKSEQVSRRQIYAAARHTSQAPFQTRPSLQARLSKWFAPPRSMLAETPPHSGTFYICNPSADNSNEESPVNQSFTDIDSPPPATTLSLFQKSSPFHKSPPTTASGPTKPPPLLRPPQSRSHHHQNPSLASSTFLNRLSTASTASTISTSRFPTAPTTPPISRNASIHQVRTVARSSSIRSVVPQLVHLPPALPSRSSSLASLVPKAAAAVLPEWPLKPLDVSSGGRGAGVPRAEYTVAGENVQMQVSEGSERPSQDGTVRRDGADNSTAQPKPPATPPDVPLRVRRRDLIMDLERSASARRAREMGQFAAGNRTRPRGGVREDWS